LGRFFLRGAERIIARLPFIRALYHTSKQLVGTFSDSRRAVFQKVVLVEFPNGESRAMGLLTGKVEGNLAKNFPSPMVSVFIPTTPNPTSGFLIFVPADRCVPLPLSVSDAMKTIVSGGAFIPNGKSDAPGEAEKS
jgi:uncharacterized membrane protein